MAGEMKRIQLDRKSKPLGQGGQGTVWRGTFDGIAVAVKRFLLDNDEISQRREVDSLKTLDHPNIVRLYHTEEDDDFR